MAKRATADPRYLAWRVLLAVDAGAYADAELAASMSRVEMEPRDRALLTRLVYGTLAWQGYLDHAIASLGRHPDRLDAEIRVLLRIAILQLAKLSRVPDFAVVDTSVELAKAHRRGAASGLVNAVLRSFLRREREVPLPNQQSDPIGRLAIELSHPRWLVERWVGEIGIESTRALLAADNEAAPTVLRVNRLRATREVLLARLAHAGVEAERTTFSPDGVRVQSGRDPTALPGYAEGLFTLQGEASQLIVALLGLEPHSRVLDACAAPGGKTTHIAEHLGERGMVISSDRSRAGLEYLRATARRMGVGGIEALNADARALPLAADLLFDAALIDAPCSGLGTLRQHPEIRWRRDPAQLSQLIDLQRQLVAVAAARVRPGGALVYATCTLLASENEQVVEDFVSAHPDFELEHAAPFLPPTARGLVDEHGYLRTWPHRDGLDGFFAARLKRRG